MKPNSGNVDIWNWSLATSNPLGYAHDLVANASGFNNDAGGSMHKRNSDGTNDRSAAKYEWDGTDQTITLPSGAAGLLDPTFYLLNKKPMVGDAHQGELIYASVCEHCHGPNGIGGEYSAINGVGANKKSREAYMAAMDNVGDMGGYWGPLSAQQKDDVVTFLRGISGAPGYYLVPPTPNTSAADITIISNVKPTDISNAMGASTNKHGKYQVLIKRKLKTNNPDDVQFNLTTKKEYVFGIALMDNDGKNHIGSAKETLTFK
jgi:mono/diheme cytochrome c family protein